MPKKIVHQWTEKERIVLCLLQGKYERRYITQIWSYIFKNKLRREGFHNDIPITRLDSQFQDIRIGRQGHKHLVTIMDSPDATIEDRYGPYLREILKAIRELHITPTIKPKVNSKSKTKRPKRYNRRTNRAVSVPTTIVTDFEGESEDERRSQSLRNGFTNQISPYFNTAGPSDKDSARSSSTIARATNLGLHNDTGAKRSRKHPMLLFRATPTIAHFRSRRYARPADNILPPGPSDTKAFRDIVLPHVQRCHAFVSPFISFSETPRWALNLVRIKMSERIDQKMFLVIFASADLRKNAIESFGEDSGPYFVKDVVEKEDLLLLPGSYNGSREWLMYGAIGCEPVAILDSAQAYHLSIALRRLSLNDFSVISQIGKSLAHIADEWRDLITTRFLTGYCKKVLPGRGTNAFKVLLKNIFNGRTEPQPELGTMLTEPPMVDGEGDETLTFSDEDNFEDDIENLDKRDFETDKETFRHDSLLNDTQRKNTLDTACTILHSHPSVSKLNSIATRSRAQNRGSRNMTGGPRRTPFWSPDTEFGEVCQEDRPRHDSSRNPLANQRSSSTFTENDWDEVNEDLEAILTKEYPSIARKASRYLDNVGTHTEIMPSIEENSQEYDIFTAELIQSAARATPRPVPIAENRNREYHTLDEGVRRLEKVNTITKTGSGRDHLVDHIMIDLTQDVKVESSDANTAAHPRRLITSQSEHNEGDDEDDEDYVIVPGSTRRGKLQLSMRGLSVQD